MSSGDDIEAGMIATAESITHILGARPFDGFVILRAAPQTGDLGPKITLDGIHGVGNSQESGPFGTVPDPGGTGVVGFGGENQGTGIAGLGGGVNGRGGIGVHGTGGSVDHFSGFGIKEFPGAGVVGQGGREKPTSTSQFQSFSHGAGVIAVAGGSRKPIPPQVDTGGVGVYAQGAEAQVFIDDFGNISGDIKPGPGVLGRGGVRIPGNVPIPPEVAAGVIGLAGDTAIPSISESGDCGVYGAGPVGVFGHGDVVGVRAKSQSEQAAVFESSKMAQLWLVPLPMANPTALATSNAGEILATSVSDPISQGGLTRASLWFCKIGGGPGAAQWVQLA